MGFGRHSAFWAEYVVTGLEMGVFWAGRTQAFLGRDFGLFWASSGCVWGDVCVCFKLDASVFWAS